MVCRCYITQNHWMLHVIFFMYLNVDMLPAVIMGGDFLSGDQEVTMDDKSAVKAKGLWEDWHMRQAVDQAVRANHRSGIDHPFKLYNQICLLQFSSIIFSLRSTYGRDICT